jgi:hypothetical protein
MFWLRILKPVVVQACGKGAGFVFLANKEHPAGAKARVILWASSV